MCGGQKGRITFHHGTLDYVTRDAQWIDHTGTDKSKPGLLNQLYCYTIKVLVFRFQKIAINCAMTYCKVFKKALRCLDSIS